MQLKKGKKKEPVYSFLDLRVIRHETSVDASINYEARVPKPNNDDVRVFSFTSKLMVLDEVIHPESNSGEMVNFTVYGQESSLPHDLKLKDCRARDETGTAIYKKNKGEDSPLYNIPKGIGYIQKVRGEKRWTAVVWIAPHAITDMIILLAQKEVLYLKIHEQKFDRFRWIVNFTLQTNHPEDD